jgi:hypothetical protein
MQEGVTPYPDGVGPDGLPQNAAVLPADERMSGANSGADSGRVTFLCAQAPELRTFSLGALA